MGDGVDVQERMRPRFAHGFTPDPAAGRIKKQIEDIHVDDAFAKRSARLLERLTKSAADGSKGHAVVITGPTGAGKTHLIQRFRKQEIFSPFGFDDEEGLTTPLVFITAPAPCTLTTLGRAIYHKLTGGHLRDNVREHAIWDRVRAQLAGQGVSVLVIDEMHHVLVGRSEEERRKVAETLKNVMQNEDWPVHLVLAGIPTLKDFCEAHSQLRRRCRFTPAKPVPDDGKGRVQVERYLEILQGKLPDRFVAELARGDLPERFRLAADGYLGMVAVFVKLSAELCVDLDQDEITVDVLGEVFETMKSCGRKRNPFLIENLATYRPVRQPDDSRKTRLRGKRQVVDVEGA